MRRKTPEDYHVLAKAYGFEWLGPEVKRVSEKTRWQCQYNHQWYAQYNSIQQGNGCPYCAGNARKIPKDFHELACNRGFQWLGPIVRNNSTKTKWQCERGHVWKARYGSVQQGQGCPVCKQSKGENAIASFLKRHSIIYQRQKKFNKCKNINHLPFDFSFQIGCFNFLVEYDGEQHFHPIDWWGGKKKFHQV